MDRSMSVYCRKQMQLKYVVLTLLVIGVSTQAAFAKDSATGELTVAVAQLPSSEAGDFKDFTRLAKEAKKNDARLIVYPESSVFGWLNPEVFTQSQPIPGAHSDAFIELATSVEIWVAAGLAERGPEIPGEPGEYEVYDSAILVNPKGKIVLHHRKYQVLKNAFNPEKCPCEDDEDGCEYLAGNLEDMKTAETPFGITALLVCADAYTYDKTTLLALKKLRPEFVIVPWGIAASKQSDCGAEGFNAAEYGAQAAKVLETAYVVGANGVGDRPYGRFLPSVYCGASGLASPEGKVLDVADSKQELDYFKVPAKQTIDRSN